MGPGGQRFWRQGRLSQHDSLDRGATLSAPFAFSAGTASARTSLPAQACDAHIHVYDSRFPAVVGASLHPPDATIEDYRLVQQRMGTERAVLVTPSTYGADNRPMLAGTRRTRSYSNCWARGALGSSCQGVTWSAQTMTPMTRNSCHWPSVSSTLHPIA